jgi:hypothetical protein
MPAASYSSTVAELLRPGQLQPLGPGTPDRMAHERLRALTPDRLFGPAPITDREMARACLAGLWLYHNCLDESHQISQDIDTATGSFWHGIMHRREPDAGNAAYWFRRVGDHPVFSLLATEARELGLKLGAERWDPFAFIAQCEVHRGTDSEQEMLLRRVQQREWELLFDWCYRRAAEE